MMGVTKMPDDYVKRSDVHKVFQPKYAPAINRAFAAMIDSVPAADVVEVRPGRWVNGRCSECGEHAPFWSMASTYHLSKYCPSCGAKMDGGQDE